MADEKKRVMKFCPDCRGLGHRLRSELGVPGDHHAVLCSRCDGLGKVPAEENVTAENQGLDNKKNGS